MKLDYDKIIELLTNMEAVLDMTNRLTYNNQNFDDNTLYAVLKMSEAGLIDAQVEHDPGTKPTIYVSSITWFGHEYLKKSTK